MLGGQSIVPGLSLVSQKSDVILLSSRNSSDGRTNQEKQMEILEYLKTLPRDQMATFVDISRELQIDLSTDVGVLEMIKSNPVIDRSLSSDGHWSFQYRAKFVIKNKMELLQNIARVKNGILEEDIKKCYPGIEFDYMSLIIGGDIIASKNKEKQCLVLYPRGDRFFSKLSGTVTATPGQQCIITSTSLCEEIRRGEAIKVDEYWYRVDSAIGSGSLGEQNQRSSAPPSVTLDKELSDKNKYFNTFTAKSLPLDGDFDGDREYSGVALKHGCTNDVKDCWKKTVEGLKPFIGNEEALQQELVSLKLLSKPFTVSQESKRRMGGKQKEKKERQKRKPRDASSTSGYGVNAHLRGTILEKILRDK